MINCSIKSLFTLLVLVFSTFLSLNPAFGANSGADLAEPPKISPELTRSIGLPLWPSADKNHVFVYLKINNHNALPFLLDTGTTEGLLIEDWASEELGIKKSAEPSIVEPGHSQLFRGDIQSIEAVTTDAGQPLIQVNFKSALCGKVGMLPVLQNGERCAGVVGMPFFEIGVFTFDFSSGRLLFYPDGGPSISKKTSVTLPLIQSDAAQSRYFVPIATGGTSYNYLLDTGADTSFIPRVMLPTFLKAFPPPMIFLTFSAYMSEANGAWNDAVLVKNFPFQTMKVPFTYFTVVDAPTASPYPALGMDLLMHFTVTIDIKNKVLMLTPRNESSEGSTWNQNTSNTRFLHTSVGFGLRSQKRKWLVSKLIKGSPAERGGMQENDEILTLNGQTLPDELQPDLHDVVTPADTTMCLRLLRGGKLLTKQVAVSNDLDKTTYLPLGIRFLPINQQDVLIVSAVLSGSAASKAGLKVGDFVTGANGVMFRGKIWEVIQPLLVPLPGKRFVLEIGRRPGANWTSKFHLIKMRLIINK